MWDHHPSTRAYPATGRASDSTGILGILPANKTRRYVGYLSHPQHPHPRHKAVPISLGLKGEGPLGMPPYRVLDSGVPLPLSSACRCWFFFADLCSPSTSPEEEGGEMGNTVAPTSAPTFAPTRAPTDVSE